MVDWYKFASGPARHLHTSWYKCSSFSKLSTYRPLDKVFHCTSVSPYCLPGIPSRHVAERGWYKHVIVPVIHLHMSLYNYSSCPRRPTLHQLDKEAADKIWFLCQDRNTDCRRKPEEDCCRFVDDLVCHLHMSMNMSPTYPTVTIFHGLDTGRYCTVVRQHFLLRSPVRRILVVDWYMFLTECVFHFHRTECRG